VTNFDIQEHYTSADSLHSLLVNNEHLGAGLADSFNPTERVPRQANAVSSLSALAETPFPPHQTALMRGHGMTVIGASIEEAVYRSIYTCANARIQTTASLLQGVYNMGLMANPSTTAQPPPPASQESIHTLSMRERQDTWTQMKDHIERPWQLWCREVEAIALYSNELGGPS
jgi:ribulose-5-phosphate 4-epimerase/fuculose-1-phosphate aldolase